MSGFPALLRRVIAGESLEAAETFETIGAIMDERLSAVQSAALLAALATKGETVDEVVGAARAMRARALEVPFDGEAIDVCGTGGDGFGTINISTCVAFVLAGCGVAVAKHGNRAASSACGSADVLEALGIAIDASPATSAGDLREHHMAFLFAQRYHPAMRVVAPIRRELGVRTLFNVLGPLANPARVRRQMIGVAQAAHVRLLGDALQALGTQAGAIVHAENGLDEVAGDVPTLVYQFDENGARTWTLLPGDYGVHATSSDLQGGDAHANALALTTILEGERSPRADVVALNAALALCVEGRAESIDEGLRIARESLHGGAALSALEVLRRPRSRELV